MSPQNHPDAWFAAADARAQLGEIREALMARIARGSGCAAVIRELAERDRVAAAELLVGPRSQPELARLGLLVLPALEVAVQPAALYRRLGDLLPERRREVLQAAAERHPEARWLFSLSVRIEGPAAGTVHLRCAAKAGYCGEALEGLCTRYIVQGTVAGVAALVAEGHLEGLGALASAGARGALVDAAAAALDRDPTLPVVPWLTAVWAVNPASLLTEIIERMRRPESRAGLAPQLMWWPQLAGKS